MPAADATSREAPADRLLGGRLVLHQSRHGHRVGTDAILLAAAIAAPAGVIVDAGAGVGVVGLAVALRAPEAEIRLVDNDAQALTIARRNITANGFDGRVSTVTCDLVSAKSRRAAGLADSSADLVLSNPPWLDGQRSRLSPDPARAHAHVAAGEDHLDLWLRGLAAVTRPGGRMVMIYRADALQKVLDACAGRFGGVAILPVHPHHAEPAIRILVCGRKGSRAGLRLLPGLVLHADDGRFTPLVEALHRGEADLGLA